MFVGCGWPVRKVSVVVCGSVDLLRRDVVRSGSGALDGGWLGWMCLGWGGVCVCVSVCVSVGRDEARESCF